MRVLDIFEKREFNGEASSHAKKTKVATWNWEICKKVAGLVKVDTIGHGSHTGKRGDAVKKANAQAKKLGGSVCNFESSFS